MLENLLLGHFFVFNSLMILNPNFFGNYPIYVRIIPHVSPLRMIFWKYYGLEDLKTFQICSTICLVWLILGISLYQYVRIFYVAWNDPKNRFVVVLAFLHRRLWIGFCFFFELKLLKNEKTKFFKVPGWLWWKWLTSIPPTYVLLLEKY